MPSLIDIAIFMIAIAVLWAFFFDGYLPGIYGQRVCQGKAWKRMFPLAAKQEIREFLAIFVQAFAFPDKERLKFNPDDSILQIYRTLYPVEGWPDALELETLANRIHVRFNLELESVWYDDLTLGELFAITQHGKYAPFRPDAA